MIGVDLIGQIRRAYFEQHRPIKEIVRTLSVSRATVRKVIRGHATEFKYERGVQPAPKLGEWVEVLTEILEREAKLPRRERRSTQRLFEELRGRGYDGAHDSVHRFVKAWRNERARVPVHAYVPMSFAPGEAYQFDWSHETITLQGLPLMIKAAHMKLSHSRMPFAHRSPGDQSDRGPSSLDWAITMGERTWGVSILQSVEEFDAGPIWATRNFSVVLVSRITRARPLFE
jgi:transposase